MRETGVYAIRNTVNGKRCVGSAAKSLKDRWWDHLCRLRKGNHCNGHLQKSWNKYGEASFVFEILERCSPQLCIEREQAWMEELKSHKAQRGYNICPRAGSRLGTRHSEETKIKVGLAGLGRRHTDDAKARIAASSRGRVVGEETRVKLRSRKQTPAARAKIAAAARKQWENQDHRDHVSKAVAKALTGRTLSAESVAKRTEKQRPMMIARNQSLENRKKVSAALKGHSVSPETRAKIAASLRRRAELNAERS